MNDARLVADFADLCARGDTEEIDAFLARVAKNEDAKERQLTGPGALGNAACWYVGQGVPVFPLAPRDVVAHPKGNGIASATTDRSRIVAWWKVHATSNIGLPTGEAFDVIEVQPPYGYPSLADLREAGVLPPELLGRAIGPHSEQFLFVPPGSVPPDEVALPGIVFHGPGSYVPGPPSIVTGSRRYAWSTPLTPQRRTRR